MAAPMPLRERKKAMTRELIVREAQRLFEARGFDNVTVAEIADAANISVKTLFVYFRAKEDIAFADLRLATDLVDAVRTRGTSVAPADALADALIVAARRDGPARIGIERFQYDFGQSTALTSGLMRMWTGMEDRLTEVLAAEDGEPATPEHRLQAVQLVAMARTLTAPEVRTMIAAAADADSMLEDWVRVTAQSVDLGRFGLRRS
jgi:AcrR family transcriptional regulator